MAKRREVRLGLAGRCGIRLLAVLLGLLVRTWRCTVEGDDRIHKLLDAGERVLVYAWHSTLLTTTPTVGPVFRPAILISRSRDGERMAALASRFGWLPVRGSSSRGGMRALIEIIREIRAGHVGAQVVDGPRGPARIFKPGLIAIAQHSGAWLVPVHATSDRHWETRGWDRQQIPLPFARVVIRYGEATQVPRRLDRRAAEQLRQQLEQRYEQEALELVARAGSGSGSGS